MPNTVKSKIQKKVQTIIELQSEIRKWKDKSEEGVSALIHRFEKTPRDEVSIYFIPYFTDDTFSKILIQIANTYKDNRKLQINVISALGNMISRYKLEETQEIYDYFKANMFKKGISAFVAIHLPYLKGFIAEEKPWDYFMSIHKMAPKKIAEEQFVAVIREHILEIPNDYRDDVISFLKQKKQAANNEGGKKYYQELIDKIEN
ncbi:hypothetical protein EII40_06940 [Tannerella forsythia]|uniref:HEAT repeat domain-containing protein n=2 Tax=Tannerella forsythia TaxID=28112 RepID=A0A3P1XPV9_TANFO|nr:hypothetical protein EII40_06940 [Tannerella forsythia]